jgi:hypothetical protein
LLGPLLQGRAQPISQATEVRRNSAALVLCCHGAPGLATDFDSKLKLGGQELNVGQIVQHRLGPPLALLPACHAGETRSDSANNALGVAAGFLLGGRRVVVDSCKAVSDALAQWSRDLQCRGTVRCTAMSA